MKFGKIFSALLATFMLGSTAVFATDPLAEYAGSGGNVTDPTDATVTGNTINGDNGTANIPFEGTINVTQLKVVVPATVPFIMDPSINITNSVSQITAPANVKFINNSVVPVTVKVTGVTTSSGVTLQNEAGQLTGANGVKSVMFALKNTSGGIAVDDDHEGSWITSTGVTTNPYLINDGSAVAADGGQMSIYVHGATKKGWKKGETFTITPTLTIAAEEYVAPTP